MNKNRIFKEKGITLIALVVTIIVLLILAGVSISVLTGENGLLNRATEAKTTSKIAEIEEQANLEYTAMLIDQLSGETSEDVALAAVCSTLKNKYKLPVQSITTDAPTVTGVIFTSENVTKSNGGTVGAISIAQGTESTIIEAEAVVTPATGSWYAIVEGKKYKIEIPTGQSKIKIAREESNVDGENNTPPVTYAVTSLDPSDSGITVGQTTGAINVPSGATGTAVITASAGEGANKKSATCTVTVLKYVPVTITAATGGTLASGVSTDGNYLEESNLTLVATADSGKKLDGWYVGSSKLEVTGNQYQIPIGTTSLAIEARFSVNIPEGHEILTGVTNRVTYGKYVNYNVNLGIGTVNDIKDDWRVFYDDGTNIYIIAADYVPISNNILRNALTSIGADTNDKSHYPYSVYWSYNSGNILSYTYKNESSPSVANGAADIFTSRPAGTKILDDKGFLGYWKSAMNETTNTNNNAKMTASLMDTKVWEEFAGGIPKGVAATLPNDNKTAYAIGGPTLSMFVESWNKTKTTQLYYNRASSTGYYVKAGSQPSTSDLDEDLRSNPDYTEIESIESNFTGDLYFPHKANISNCEGYWLASPSAGSANFGMNVHYIGKVTFTNYFSSYYGVRPVVCLPSRIGLKTGSNGNYDITNNQWDE